MKRTLAIAILTLPMTAQAFSLVWPVACSYGTDCFIENYVDRDGDPGMRDYTCGQSIYENGHDGTDIRLRNLAAMRAGVNVLAAASGTVKTTRDGVEDALGTGQHDPNHQDCGNAIILTHADGFETLYCHMRKGSVTVKLGQHVEAGEKIGEVGLSGFTDYPHLHFAVRQNGTILDPFDGQPRTSACGSAHPAPLWQQLPAYQPTALLGDGFADQVPDKQAMRDTPSRLTTLARDASTLSYWADLMGTRAGDQLALRITQPDGKVMLESSRVLDKPSPFFFTYIGKRLHAPLTIGTYHATATLTRDGKIAAKAESALVVN